MAQVRRSQGPEPTRLGEDERKVLEHVASPFEVVVHIRPKLSCRQYPTMSASVALSFSMWEFGPRAPVPWACVGASTGESMPLRPAGFIGGEKTFQTVTLPGGARYVGQMMLRSGDHHEVCGCIKADAEREFSCRTRSFGSSVAGTRYAL